jgi:hypothetical protein
LIRDRIRELRRNSLVLIDLRLLTISPGDLAWMQCEPNAGRRLDHDSGRRAIVAVYPLATQLSAAGQMKNVSVGSRGV